MSGLEKIGSGFEFEKISGSGFDLEKVPDLGFQVTRGNPDEDATTEDDHFSSKNAGHYGNGPVMNFYLPYP